MRRTVTVSLNTLWQPSDAKIAEQLRRMMQGGVSIVSVERAFFSNRYAVTLDAPETFSESLLTQSFIFALTEMGYSPDVLKIEGGNVSTVPGGIDQAAGAVGDFAKFPLVMVAIIAVSVAVFRVGGNFKQ